MTEGTAFARLQKKLDEMERKYSLKELREKARKAGVSPSGTKRDITTRLFVEHARHAVPMTVTEYYHGGWKPGDFAIYSDFGLRSLYIVRILPWPEGKGDRLTEYMTFGAIVHDRSMGSVRAEVVDASLVEWDMKDKRPLYEFQREGSVHYYDYTNLYRNIEDLIAKEKRILYPEVLVKMEYDLRRHPGWLMLAAYGLRNRE